MIYPSICKYLSDYGLFQILKKKDFSSLSKMFQFPFTYSKLCAANKAPLLTNEN